MWHVVQTEYIVVGEVQAQLTDITEEPDSIIHDDRMVTVVANLPIRDVAFRIDSLLKGDDLESTIEIHSMGSNCDRTFKIGERYLLFLVKIDDHFQVRVCSYSEKFDPNSETYQELSKYLRMDPASLNALAEPEIRNYEKWYARQLRRNRRKNR